MKVALAHHWLTQHRGGEKVLENIAGIFPGCDLFTLIHNRRLDLDWLDVANINTSFLDRVPGSQKLYRHLLPLHPAAIGRMRVPNDVDLLISSDAAMIKGLKFAASTKHVCYCHSPPRYLWEMGNQYKRTSLAARVALDRFAPALRRFDFDAAQNVTQFIANSHFVADRIRKYYQRDAQVVYPPVAVEDFQWKQNREGFALVVSELVPYKRIDIAIEAFNRIGRRLVVIGDGPERRRLQAAAGPNIQFLGRQPFRTLKSHFQRAAMFIFPGVEDFGITPVESQAAGCPVIAYRAGGALETVIEERTGIFFDQQNAEALADAVTSQAASRLEAADCRANAEKFSAETFRQRFSATVSKLAHASPPHAPIARPAMFLPMPTGDHTPTTREGV